uniref:HDC08826 n=1 Tax=Drosophila melanogaster TaxID=7227 RepID=Q6ILN8_DROME|nr:TPA_inf: HDC08826 [Drosophila melanogaster]
MEMPQGNPKKELRRWKTGDVGGDFLCGHSCCCCDVGASSEQLGECICCASHCVLIK